VLNGSPVDQWFRRWFSRCATVMKDWLSSGVGFDRVQGSQITGQAHWFPECGSSTTDGAFCIVVLDFDLVEIRCRCRTMSG
jgi:hypothetical protein